MRRSVQIGMYDFAVVELPELSDEDGVSCGARSDRVQRTIFTNGSIDQVWRELSLWKVIANERQAFATQPYLIPPVTSFVELNDEQADERESET